MHTQTSGAGHTSRILFIEFLFGAVMFAAVAVHGAWNLCEFGAGFYDEAGLMPENSDGGNLGPLTALVECLYPCLMLFFIVSGYFYKPDRDVRASLRRRLKKLLVPFLVCIVTLPLVTYALMCAMGTSLTPWEALADTATLLMGSSFMAGLGFVSYNVAPMMVLGPFYFIETMIFADIIFFAIVRKVTSDPRIAAVTIIAMLLIGGILADLKLGIFNIDKSFIAVAFMLVGVYLKRADVFSNLGALMKKPAYWAVFLVASVAMVALATFFPTGLAFNQSSFGNVGILSGFTLFALAMASMTVFVTVMWLVFHIPGIKQLFTFTGRYTFQILLFNMFFLVISGLVVKGEKSGCLFFDSIPDAIPFILFSVAMCVLTGVVMKYAKSRIDGVKSVG